MPRKSKKDYGKATLAGAMKEMAKPRVAKSAGKKLCELRFVVYMDQSKKAASS
jgi:hypothetical protein